MLKAARQDMVLQLFNTGLLGDVAAPETKRRALSLLEMGALEEGYDFAKAHELKAKQENREVAEGRLIPPPEFCDNHQLHYDFHASQLISPETRNWPATQKRALIAHMLLHGRFIDPMSAMAMAVELGITEVMPYLQQVLAAMAPPAPGPPGSPSGQPPTPPPGPGGPA
jgi:hypothetical protein